MKKVIFLMPFLLLSECLVAQTQKKVVLDDNKVSAEKISPELQQIFPDFRKGSVHYKGMMPINCSLNYNFLMDEILFINEKGEKMALANPEDLSHVLIAGRTFIPSSKGYYEVVENGDVSLVYKWICRISKVGKEGALGLSTDAPSVYQLNRFSFDAKEWKLGVDEEAVVNVEVRPYLKTKSRFIQVRGSKSFLKAFQGKKTLINKYLQQNPVDLKKEADLRRMTLYGNSLVE
jgi:hypothetical protein